MKKKKESMKQPLHLTPVDSIPPKSKCKHPVNDFIETFDNFRNMSCEVVKVDTGKSDPHSNYMLYTAVTASLKNIGYPIKAVFRIGEVYLVKKDIK